MEKEIMNLLRSLGITQNRKGFYYLAEATMLALEDAERLFCVTKQIYPDVAKRYATTAACVERDIRTVTRMAWKQNPALISVLAGHEVMRTPTSTQLLSYMLSYLECKV